MNITHLESDFIMNLDDKKLLNVLSGLENDFTYIPNSGNMGDVLIAAATILFFERNGIQYRLYREKKKNNTIVYGGGGQWTKDYRQYWIKWLKIFRNAERVVILPSSFRDCDELINIIDERFTVFCREKDSYNYLINNNCKGKIILDHDMAFRMHPLIMDEKSSFCSRKVCLFLCIWKIFLSLTPREVCFILRTDVESILPPPNMTDIDISNFIYIHEYSSRDFILFYGRYMLSFMKRFKIIVTDRLHVCIAASLMKKEVILLDNSYGKNSAVYNHSLYKNDHVNLAASLPQFKRPARSKFIWPILRLMRGIIRRLCQI